MVRDPRAKAYQKLSKDLHRDIYSIKYEHDRVAISSLKRKGSEEVHRDEWGIIPGHPDDVDDDPEGAGQAAHSRFSIILRFPKRMSMIEMENCEQ